MPPIETCSDARSVYDNLSCTDLNIPAESSLVADGLNKGSVPRVALRDAMSGRCNQLYPSLRTKDHSNLVIPSPSLPSTGIPMPCFLARRCIREEGSGTRIQVPRDEPMCPKGNGPVGKPAGGSPPSVIPIGPVMEARGHPSPCTIIPMQGLPEGRKLHRSRPAKFLLQNGTLIHGTIIKGMFIISHGAVMSGLLARGDPRSLWAAWNSLGRHLERRANVADRWTSVDLQVVRGLSRCHVQYRERNQHCQQRGLLGHGLLESWCHLGTYRERHQHTG